MTVEPQNPNAAAIQLLRQRVKDTNEHIAHLTERTAHERARLTEEEAHIERMRSDVAAYELTIGTLERTP